MSRYPVWFCKAKTYNFLALLGETNCECWFSAPTVTGFRIIFAKIPDIIITVMSTLPLLARDLRFFASSPALPLWYINLPLFTSTINIEYLVKDWTLITAFLFSLNHKEMLKLR